MSDKNSDYASGTNINFIENLYEDYKIDANNVDPSWQHFFKGYEVGLISSQQSEGEGEIEAQHVGEERRQSSRIESMINTYRQIGYMSANLDPLLPAPEIPQKMTFEEYGSNIDANRKFLPTNFGHQSMTFKEIWDKLRSTYCGTVGPDYQDLNDLEAVGWLQEKMEACNNKPKLSNELKLRIMQKLSDAEGFEQFLHTRYLGQKRFSLEGLESLIPLLDILIDESSKSNIEEICIGMAHRGRLNVLANIMEKPQEKMLVEFEGSEYNPFDIDGDVKYHLGFANKTKTFSGNTIRLYLSPNPSHLEAVNPLVEGFCYARQERSGGTRKTLPVLLHGDAAVIGQGIVSEVLNLSQIENYQTGGTIHIITNNKIGFTTNPECSRSCYFNSDISKMIRSPVLHVNADDPEAVVWVAQLAVSFRNKFKRDIVIDLIGYRRHGHNETDEPSFTQPLLYKKIKEHPSVLTTYSKKLLSLGITDEKYINSCKSKVKKILDDAQDKIKAKNYKTIKNKYPEEFNVLFKYKKPERNEVIAKVKTSISDRDLSLLAKTITKFPDNFTPHTKINRLIDNRKKMLDKKGAIDWSFAELLALSSIAKDGKRIRLSGQDCKRGTFSNRHSVIFDFKTGKEHPLLKNKNWAPVDIINSPLSEQGCLGFEFGYSTACAKTLVIWEAQFGDFANGAQIIIDQFIVASEAKWQQTSSLVMLLPHGYEGMGPEHSSARPERFLQACGNLNIQVCNFTTPAQYFHALRRQMLRDFRKPLVVMTPKSLLRHPKLVSTKEDFTNSYFKEILEEDVRPEESKVSKIILCTGKIYFDLAKNKEENTGFKNTPIVRIEQLYPFPYERLESLFKKYSKVKEVVWVQEEPQNMGAWTFVNSRIPNIKNLNARLTYVGRKGSGSTAEGSSKAHNIEQNRIVNEAFSLVCAWEPKVVK